MQALCKLLEVEVVLMSFDTVGDLEETCSATGIFSAEELSVLGGTSSLLVLLVNETREDVFDGPNASGGIARGLKGNMPVALNPPNMLTMFILSLYALVKIPQKTYLEICLLGICFKNDSQCL